MHQREWHHLAGDKRRKHSEDNPLTELPNAPPQGTNAVCSRCNRVKGKRSMAYLTEPSPSNHAELDDERYRLAAIQLPRCRERPIAMFPLIFEPPTVAKGMSK